MDGKQAELDQANDKNGFLQCEIQEKNETISSLKLAIDDLKSMKKDSEHKLEEKIRSKDDLIDEQKMVIV